MWHTLICCYKNRNQRRIKQLDCSILELARFCKQSITKLLILYHCHCITFHQVETPLEKRQTLMNKKLTVDCTLNICNSIIQEQTHRFWTSLFAQTTTSILHNDILLLSSPIHSIHHQNTHRIQSNNTIPSFSPIHNTPTSFQ